MCWLVFDNLAKVVTWEEEILADDLSPSDQLVSIFLVNDDDPRLLWVVLPRAGGPALYKKSEQAVGGNPASIPPLWFLPGRPPVTECDCKLFHLQAASGQCFLIAEEPEIVF